MSMCARALRRRISRTSWLARLLGLPKPVGVSDAPGLVILQLDGLSRRQFETAVRRGRLPFLSKLLRYGPHELTSFYSGMPSTTPAVQSEVMFGIRSAVPAFSFLDRSSGRVFALFESECAEAINRRNEQIGQPLLTGGHSISNLFAGGSDEARFCSQQMNMDTVWKELHPLRILLILFLYTFTALRIAGLMLVELLVGLADLCRGVYDRRDWKRELKFVASRVAVCALLRELARIHVKLAIQQGTPVVYANFLGYDEQSHRRGPSSLFAHWALKGIDGVFRDICRTAHRSGQRDYEVVVFSDHGHEDVRVYLEEYGRSIEEAARETFKKGPLADTLVTELAERPQSFNLDQRVRQMLGLRRGRQEGRTLSELELASEIVVTALGPIGHIYLPVRLPVEALAEYAQLLVGECHVPLAMFRHSDGFVHALNRRGEWKLPDDADAVLGPEHGFATQIMHDLETLCDHENAGDLLIFGWDPQQQPLTFAVEQGAHGSVGTEETRGFALLPRPLQSAVIRNQLDEPFIRGQTLHDAAWEFIRGGKPQPDGVDQQAVVDRSPSRHQNDSHGRSGSDEQRFRLLTYNIHSGIGMDGRLRLRRIADVISEAAPDIVCLQEVDCNRRRSGCSDQAALIAGRLEMQHEFFPVLDEEAEQYGLAVLSRFPFSVHRVGRLTAGSSDGRREARGAMWVEVETSRGHVHVINTHLGLRVSERREQLTALEDDWLSRIPSHEPVIVCGDLNSGPESETVRRLCTLLNSADLPGSSRDRTRPTFPAGFPLRRLDHILCSNQINCVELGRVKTAETSTASDHLPVIARLDLVSAATEALSAERARPEDRHFTFRE